MHLLQWRSGGQKGWGSLRWDSVVIRSHRISILFSDGGIVSIKNTIL